MAFVFSGDFGDVHRHQSPPVARESNALNFYALNVGLGNLLILTFGNKAMLFNSGTLEIRDVPTKGLFVEVPSPYIDPAVSILRGKEVVAVAITHPHVDHMNLITTMLQHSGNEVQHIQFISGGHCDQISDNALRLAMSASAMFSIKKVGAEYDVPAGVSERIEQFLNKGFAHGHLRFQVFMPESGTIHPTSANVHVTANIIFKVTFCNRSVLVTGDGEPQTVTTFSSSFGDVDIYIVPHHGSEHNNEGGFPFWL
jgi:beta-lactamase superfamily II metal-dependent hydrolase